MKVYKIFLASSFELKPEREAFEIAISRLNIRLNNKNVSLKLEVWENFDDSINLTSKQNDYNEFLENCHFFVLLFWTKVGKFTKIEFDLAYELFQKSNGELPRIYLYQKLPLPKGISEEDNKSRNAFLSFLKREGKEQFSTPFENVDTFIRKFETNVLDLFENENEPNFTYGKPAFVLGYNGPFKPLIFKGRDSELKLIRSKLTDSGSFVIINGDGGIGKTTVLSKFWNDSIYSFENFAWIYSGNGLIQAFRNFATSIGIQKRDSENFDLISELQKELLKKYPNLLIILDNVNSEEEILWFRQNFKGMSFRTIISTRCKNVFESQEIEIPPLDSKESISLFKEYSKSNTEEKLIEELITALDSNTLLIEVFAKRVNQSQKLGQGVKEYLEHLKNKGLYFNEDRFEIYSDYTEPKKVLKASSDEILSYLYDFENLLERDKSILSQISLLPPKSYNLNFLISLFTKWNSTELILGLEKLFASGYLGGNNGEYYRLSPVTQEIIFKKLEPVGQQNKDIIESLTDKLRNDGRIFDLKLKDEIYEYAEAAIFLQRSLANWITLPLLNLQVDASLFYLSKGDLLTSEKVLEVTIANLISLTEKISIDPNVFECLGRSFMHLSDIGNKRGDLEKTKNNLLNAQKVYELLLKKTDNKTHSYGALGIIFGQLGDLEKEIGNLSTASELITKELNIAIEVSKQKPDDLHNQFSLGVAYNRLSQIKLAQNLFQAGLELSLKSIKTLENVVQERVDHPEYHNILGISYSTIASHFHGLGNLDAVYRYQNLSLEASTIALELEPDDIKYLNSSATANQNIGNYYYSIEKYLKALEFYKKQNKLLEKVTSQSPDDLFYKSGYAISFEKIGTCWFALNEPEKALYSYKIELKIFEAILQNNPYVIRYKKALAITHYLIAKVYNNMGKIELAQYHEKMDKEIMSNF